MDNKIYFTRLEILEDLREVITDRNLDYYDGITHEAFNKVYYIEGPKEAEKALEQYGTFDAIGKVVNYELDVLGVYDTRPDDPEAVANTLYFILGVDTIYNEYPELKEAYCSVLGCEVSEENDKKLLDVINQLIDNIE